MWIHFGILNYKHLIFLLFPIFLQTQKFIISRKKNNNPFFRGFNDFLSFTLCGLIHLISKLITKTTKEKIKEKEEKEKQKQIKLELDEMNKSGENQDVIPAGPLIYEYSIRITEYKNYKLQKVQKRKKLLFILLISGLQMTAMLIKNIFREKINKQLLQNISVLLESIFLIFFSIIFLGFSMHLHQYFSFSILALCMIIFVIETMVIKKIKIFGLLSSLLYFFSYEILYCLSDVLGKKYLNIYIDGVYLFLFKVGITGLIPLIIYDIIAYYSGLDDNYHGIFKSIYDNNITIWSLLLNLFSCLFFEIGLWLTIYYFSPCHFIILETLGDFFEIISLIIENEDNGDSFELGQKITFCILYPFIIFAVLVFNEIIILNFFGLSYNTKYYIMEREKIDINSLLNRNLTVPDYEFEEEEQDQEQQQEQEQEQEKEQDNDDSYLL